MSEPFEPGKHLIQLRGKGGATDYMPVQWRLVWFREAHPDGRIDCQLVELDREAGFALFRAEITTPAGGSAVGFGSETARDFGDFIEKASTKAIGRALAALGFGTQFVGDELDEGARIVDAPAPRPQPAASRPARQDAPQLVSYKQTGEHLDKQGFRYQPRKDGAAELAARQAPATSAPTDDWTAFWSWARARGITGRDMLDAAAGCTTQGKPPTEIRALIEAHDAAQAVRA